MGCGEKQIICKIDPGIFQFFDKELHHAAGDQTEIVGKDPAFDAIALKDGSLDHQGVVGAHIGTGFKVTAQGDPPLGRNVFLSITELDHTFTSYCY